MKLNVLVVPYDSGFRDLRMGAGPARLLDAGLLEGLAAPKFEVSTVWFEASKAALRGEIASAVEIQQWLTTRVSHSRSEGAFPLVLAGNCMAAVGIVAGLQARSRRVPAVCWFDSHADFNTPDTTTSGFLDGMALATLTGRCWKSLLRSVPEFRPVPESQVLLFGARHLDQGEREALDASEIQRPKSVTHPFSASEKLGELRGHFGEVYLHIDLDVLDQSEGRANSYSTGGGYTRERLLELVHEIGTSFHVGAAALTAYDPSCDPEGRIPVIAKAIVESLSRMIV